MATRDDNNLVTISDVNDQKKRVNTLRDRLNESSDLIQITEARFVDLKNKSKKIQDFRDSFPVNEMRESLCNLSDLQNNLDSLDHEIDKEKTKLCYF